MLGTTISNSGKQFYVDQCTRCSCSNSAVSCVRETCPVHDCPSEHQTLLPGRCCPQCPEVEEVRPSCTYAGKTYGASILSFRSPLTVDGLRGYNLRRGSTLSQFLAKRSITVGVRAQSRVHQSPPTIFVSLLFHLVLSLLMMEALVEMR